MELQYFITHIPNALFFALVATVITYVPDLLRLGVFVWRVDRGETLGLQVSDAIQFTLGRLGLSWKLRAVIALAVFALAACSPTTTYDKVAATPAIQAQGGGEVVASAPVVQATPEMILAPAIDYAATQAILNDKVAKSNAQIGSLQSQLAQQNAAIKQAEANIEQAKAQTAKYNAAQTASEADKLRAQEGIAQAAAKLKDGEIRLSELENEKIKLLADVEAERTHQILTLFIGALAVCMVVAFVWVIRLRPTPVAEREVITETRPVFVNKGEWKWPPAPPGDYEIFLDWADWAVSGAAISFKGMVGAGKLFADYPDYLPLHDWAEDWDVTETVKGKLTLTKEGKTYLLDALALREKQSPPLPRDIPQELPLAA